MKHGRKGPIAASAVLLTTLMASMARGESDLLGPLRIRDMTPFNLLRLDMRPAPATAPTPSRWGVEAGLSYSNTFVMSDNVAEYLQERGSREALTAADAEAILALGEDAYYLDGETALLDLTVHYQVTPRSSVHLTLSAYSFSGGFLDGTIEGFHGSFDLENGGRDLVARDQFQVVSSIAGVRLSSLDAPVQGGIGDPVIGIRSHFPISGSRWGLVLSGEAKLAWRGERLFLSTGTNDVGVQAALQGRFERQAIYLSASFVSTDGRVFGVPVERSIVPALTAAYEAAVAEHASVILQFYASESSGRDLVIPEIKANKYEASLGLRSRRGRVTYGVAVTENIKNYENTPDIGMSLSLSWVSARS